MMKQFFGKEYFFVLAVMVAMFVDATFVYAWDLGWLALLVYGMIVFTIAVVRLQWGVVAAFVELFSNPHGMLISAQVGEFTISLRMVVFVAVLLAWVLAVLKKRVPPPAFTEFWAFWPILIAVCIGFVGGITRPSSAFSDGNAYLYLLYFLPILSAQWNARSKRLLLQTLSAGATWIVLLSLGILYLYTHFHEIQLLPVYEFLRDVRLAEITRITPSLYRVFIQSQFFPIVFSSLLVAWLFTKRDSTISRASVVFIAGAIAVVLLGLSRSFWVGLFVGTVTLLVLVIIKWRPTFKQWRGLFVHALISTALAGALIGATVLFPLPSSRNVDFADALRSRAGGDAAITSRWKLLGPMWEGVVERPVLGQGFGYPVTFTTDDPRVRAINPTGEWTTYSMEWGWLELWLKMGLMGPLSFAFLLVWLVRGLLMAHQGRLWLSIGMSASLVFLGVTHTFSPYLNHPIGIGFILFCLIFTDRDGIPSMMKVRQPSVLQQKVSSVAISSVRDGSG